MVHSKKLLIDSFRGLPLHGKYPNPHSMQHKPKLAFSAWYFITFGFILFTLGSIHNITKSMIELESSQDFEERVERDSFPTSKSSWSVERVSQYDYELTPEDDPKSKKNLLYMDRVHDQAVAEMENGGELVRYLSNTASIETSKPSYQILIRVQTNQQSFQERWRAILDHFRLPCFASVRTEFVDSEKEGYLKRLFGPPKEATDWVFVAQESTYVNLKQLVQRLFADIDPNEIIRKGLLHSINGTLVPIPEAGILFSQKALKEVWETPKTKSCWDTDSASEWTVCLAQASFQWTSLQGLNPYNSRDIVRFALERSLFTSPLSSTYDSVGGPIMGTARLPITYGNMSDKLFYDQLAVDTNHGKVPKILHHIWSGPLSNIPPEVQAAAKECQSMHEKLGWKYILWDDERLQALPGIPQLPEMLGDRKLVRFYTDAVRLYLLHRFGGVYSDVDAICLRPFDPLLKYLEDEAMDFLANYESERRLGRQIANGVMIAAPASPVLSANALHIGIKLFQNENWKRRQDVKMTGPWPTTEIRDQWESWVKPHQIILSSAAFIPLYASEGKGLDLDDVFHMAARKGSYTIQMYQTTKGKNVYKMIEEAHKSTNETSSTASENRTIDDRERVQTDEKGK